jgi:phospholipase/lecithinase/hemolysin
MTRLQRMANLPSRLARTALALALLSGALQPGAAQAKLSTLNQLFVFGDSLSDIGNAGSLSGGFFPPLPTSATVSATVR